MQDALRGNQGSPAKSKSLPDSIAGLACQIGDTQGIWLFPWSTIQLASWGRHRQRSRREQLSIQHLLVMCWPLG